MCQEKIIFEERPRKVLLFAKSPKFYCKADLQISLSYQYIKKNIFAGKGDLLIHFLIKWIKLF